MFALSFYFPAGRYHATPWGRNVNEAAVAWPPEPWRLLRTLIAIHRRKGNFQRWPEDDLAVLIDKLSSSLPDYSMPEGAVHAHTRHYMPELAHGRRKTTLVVDAFLRLPTNAKLVVCWPTLSLEGELFSLAAYLADAIGYFGRAESWVECRAVAAWDGKTNCRPASTGFQGDPVRLIAALGPDGYSTERNRILSKMKREVLATTAHALNESEVDAEVESRLICKVTGAHTVPERLVDALALDTIDYQDAGWRRPPAAQEVVYSRAPEVAPSLVSGRVRRDILPSRQKSNLPTVARFLLAGRPLPRIEDAVKIGELMRLAALAKFGWRDDETTGRRMPQAPPEISGRGPDGKPLKDPSHKHAFWLPEDAAGDGWIDHVSVYVPAGMSASVQAKLDRITRLWIAEKQPTDERDDPGRKEWRLALEGFGKPSDFASGTGIFGKSRCWQSVTPFLSAGYLKGAGYPGEVRRLLQRRGVLQQLGTDPADIEIHELCSIKVGGTERRTIHFHRFRSRSRERQPDAAGAFLRVVFPRPFEGPLCLGFGSHVGLGLFVAQECGDT